MAFKVGDAVRLKSGGAQMIVSKLFKSPEGREMVSRAERSVGNAQTLIQGISVRTPLFRRGGSYRLVAVGLAGRRQRQTPVARMRFLGVILMVR
jgi:hypothetical protein